MACRHPALYQRQIFNEPDAVTVRSIAGLWMECELQHSQIKVRSYDRTFIDKESFMLYDMI